MADMRRRNTLLIALILLSGLSIAVFKIIAVENRPRKDLEIAVNDLCLGMKSEAVKSVLLRHGIQPVPLPREGNIERSFSDSSMGIINYLNPDKRVTYFCISDDKGLWLIYTQRYRYYLDDDFKREYFTIPICE